MRVEYDRRGLVIDGQPRLIRSASLDYFRIPSTAEWRDRIEKIAAAGFNCVSVAYPWTFHAEASRNHDFEGVRDVGLLQRMIEDAGLYRIARVGPHVGCDIDSGGLPAWLLASPQLLPRCRVAGEFCYSPEYMLHVEQWFDAIVPRVVEGVGLLLVEVEHQYALPAPVAWLRSDAAELCARWIGAARTVGLARWLTGSAFVLASERDGAQQHRHNPYMETLCRWLRERGVAVPTTHADLAARPTQADVDVPAIERRRFDLRRSIGALQAELAAMRADGCSDAARVYLGLDAGVSDGWAGPGYPALRQREVDFPSEALVLAAVGSGATVYNVKRFCGGTNWGYLSTPDAYSSHDVAAPIAEDGSRSPAYWAFARLNAWLAEFEEELCTSSLVETRMEGNVSMWSRRSVQRLFRFVQSTSPGAEELAYTNEPRTSLEPFETQMRVYRLPASAPSGASLDSPVLRFEAVNDLLRADVPAEERRAPDALPALETWTCSRTSAPLDASFDDESWPELGPDALARGACDMDSLGLHHGFAWYRGAFNGTLERLSLAVRHSYAVWLNRELIAEGDADTSAGSIGLDPPLRGSIRVPSGLCGPGRNSLVILVESRGHPDGLLDGYRQPVGLLSLDTGATRVRWRYRSGLLRGERGVAPMVAFEAVDRAGAVPVSLPHALGPDDIGVGLYETDFRLDGVDLEKLPLGVRIDPSCGRANVYLNGTLIGRYWPERGPQSEFYLPRGMLHEAPHENHLAIAVWKRSRGAALGRVRLVRYGA